MFGNNLVVLIHGMGVGPAAMLGLQWYLRRQQYRVINQGYRSRRQDIESLSYRYFERLLPKLPATGKINFVTHSLGGLLLLHGLQHWFLPQDRWGRAVLLSPPVAGSELVDSLEQWPMATRLLGPAFAEMTTHGRNFSSLHMADWSGSPALEIGVIAGRKYIGGNRLFQTDDVNDGVLTVDRTRVPGMTDFRALEVNHVWMINDRRTRQQISHFLSHGLFI